MVRKTLILTIGTGNIDRLQETLFTPLKKSVQTGEWTNVILLPSKMTQQYAEQFVEKLRDEVGEQAVQIIELPQAHDEDNVDRCYAHFCSVMEQCLQDGLQPDQILPDYTRGTKSMSAALVLAAVRFEIPVLRYICSIERDERGMVVPGTEQIGEFRTETVGRQRLLDQAHTLFSQSNFSAVLDILPGDSESGSTVAIRTLASACAAWERLDYDAAAERMQAVNTAELPAGWQVFAPPVEVVSWLKKLAKDLPQQPRQQLTCLRRVAVDLYANGQRRIDRLQLEDAYLRAYRLADLLIQIRRVERGKTLSRKPLQLFRELDALIDAGDGYAKRLKWLFVQVQERNNSILAHGLKAIAADDERSLPEIYRELRKDLRRGNPDFESQLQHSQWLRFS